MSSSIKNIHARQILDSRGNPTLEVEVELYSGEKACASVPSGASTGKFEAVELRDKNSEIYGGKSVMVAVNNVNKIIASALIGDDVSKQYDIDKKIIELEGTDNKGKLGANATLGVSLACARVAAKYYGQELYEYLGGICGNTLPVPMMNILNGGVHANNNLEFQEFMIAPVGAENFSHAIQISAEIFYSLKSILKKRGLSVGVGDEGGFAPELETNIDAIELLIDAILTAGYSTDSVKICLDVASSEFFNGNKYYIRGQGYSSEEFVEILSKLVEEFPIVSIEDGLSQEDWAGWEFLTKQLGNRCQLVGDDLFVTNLRRIKMGVEKSCANSVLIKPNQIGTLSETLDAIKFSKSNGYTTVISHRSGETEDTFIADLSVGVNSGLIKTGSLSRGERIAKYNRLLKIEEILGSSATFLGLSAFNISRGFV
mgnify:FL=1